MKYTPRSTSDKRLTQGSETPVTLPAMPFEMPAAVTDETAPRVATIRRKMRKMSKPKQLLCSRPVFDHGDCAVMTLDDYQTKTLRAFWHKSRRVFVPCTALDIAARSGLKSADKAGNIAADLTREGLLRSSSINGRHVYDITPKGRDVFSGKPITETVKPKAERVIAPLQNHNAKRRMSADARRCKIIAMLSEREMTVEQLADALTITQSPPNNLRKVLRELRDEGKLSHRAKRNGRVSINYWRAV